MFFYYKKLFGFEGKEVKSVRGLRNKNISMAVF